MVMSTGAQNLNLAQQNNFEIFVTPKYVNDEDFDRLDTHIIKLWANKIPIASINSDTTKWALPVNDIQFPTGGKETFSDFTISFLLTENLGPYITLRKWLERNDPFKQRKDYPRKFDPYRQKKFKDFVDIANTDGERTPDTEWEHIDYRDIIIDIKSLTNLTSCKIVYIDSFPVSISNIDLTTTSSDIINFNVTFKCLYMDIIGDGGNSLIYC